MIIDQILNAAKVIAYDTWSNVYLVSVHDVTHGHIPNEIKHTFEVQLFSSSGPKKYIEITVRH